MTFELSAEYVAVRDKARALAQTVRARAAEIDRGGEVPAEWSHEVAGLAAGDPLAAVIAVEEVAVSSGAVAMAALGNGSAMLDLSGLRGARVPEDSPLGQLSLAAVALGLGRAALEAALAEVRETMAAAGSDTDKPQWVLADVATDLDAARLLAYKAARTMAPADIALARLLASSAAQRAVDAALRVAGIAGLAIGSSVERLSRDVRAVSLLLGTEEQQRSVAAAALLPG